MGSIVRLAGLATPGPRAWPVGVGAIVLIRMAVISQRRFRLPVMPLTLVLSAAGPLALFRERTGCVMATISR